jgi:hypothetical protein
MVSTYLLRPAAVLLPDCFHLIAPAFTLAVANAPAADVAYLAVPELRHIGARWLDFRSARSATVTKVADRDDSMTQVLDFRELDMTVGDRIPKIAEQLPDALAPPVDLASLSSQQRRQGCMPLDLGIELPD